MTARRIVTVPNPSGHDGSLLGVTSGAYSFTAAPASQRAKSYYPEDFGAVGGVLSSRSVTTTSGSPNVVCTTDAPWASGDVGKFFAGPNIPAGTKIQTFTDSSHIILDHNASSTITLTGNDSVTGARCIWYTQDDSTAIGLAVTAVASTGGRVTFLSNGYVCAGLTLNSRTTFEGLGMGATVLYRSPGSTSDLVTTASFGSLTGTGSLHGVYQASLQRITLDCGGDSWATGAGYCLRQFGHGLNHDQLELRYGASGNFYSEFGRSDDATTNGRGGPQACMGLIVSHHSQSSSNPSIEWRGPHDSTCVSMHTFLNIGEGLVTKDDGSTYTGSGLQIIGFHSYANGSSGTDGIRLEAPLGQIDNAQFELGSACTCCLRIWGQGVKIGIAEFYPGGTNYAVGANAVVVGKSGTTPSGVIIGLAKITGFGTNLSPATGAAMDLTYSGGYNLFQATINSTQTGGSLVTLGSNSAVDQMNITITGSSNVTGLLQTSGSGGKTSHDFKGQAIVENYQAGTNGTKILGLETNDTKRGYIEFYSGPQNKHWWIDHAGASNTDVGANNLGFRTDGTLNGSVLALLQAGGVFIANSAVPSTPTAGGVLYVVSGALTYKGSSGTVTTLANA